MKYNSVLTAFYFLFGNTSFAQTNTYPANGNVGIGTTTPSAKLQIEKELVIDYNNIGSTTGTVHLNAPSLYHNSTALTFGGAGYTADRAQAGIYVQSSGTYGTKMYFATTDSYAMGSRNRMMIDHYGNVGIGTTNPLYALDISSTTTGSSRIYLHPATGTDFALMQFSNNGGTSYFGMDNSNGSGLGSSTPYALTMYSGSVPILLSAGGAERMRVATNGNVGIGTTNPTYKFETVTTGAVGFRLQTSGSGVGNPQIDMYDASTGQETVISSSDGIRTGTYIASYSNHPLFFGTNHSQAQAVLSTTGNFGIGTITPTDKLTVNGNIRAKKLIVTQNGWSDYVFAKNYKLRTLSEVENYIKTNQHLPEVPSAKEVAFKGINVGDTQALLLKKIEELTLYMIVQEKKQEKLVKTIEILQTQIFSLQKNK